MPPPPPGGPPGRRPTGPVASAAAGPYLVPHVSSHPPTAVPDRRLRADLSRVLRADLPAAPHRQGENTSAAWGVVNFLLRLREKYQPDYLAWVHDAGDSFRTALYPEYKSTREKLDDELQAEFDRSVERIEQLLTAFHVPVVSVPGYEADDVIGSLARLRGGTRLAGGDRLGRQGLLSADRARRFAAQPRAGRARRRRRALGRRIQRRRTALASRRRR